MSNLSRMTAWVLGIGLVLVCVFPLAADFMVCIDERPDRGCCDELPARDTRTGAAARLLESADCGCCVTVHVVSNATDATVQKIDVVHGVEAGYATVDDAPITRSIVSTGRDEPGDARLPSLRTVVLLI